MLNCDGKLKLKFGAVLCFNTQFCQAVTYVTDVLFCFWFRLIPEKLFLDYLDVVSSGARPIIKNLCLIKQSPATHYYSFSNKMLEKMNL